MSHLQVVDGRRHFGAPLETVVRQHPVFVLQAARVGFTVPHIEWVDQGAALVARINHNRWIVDCPDCAGAEFVWLDQPLTMCANCWNGVVGGKWRRVILPAPAERAQIEAVLHARPIPQNRNWRPGESVAKLKAENRKHKLPAEVS